MNIDVLIYNTLPLTNSPLIRQKSNIFLYTRRDHVENRCNTKVVQSLSIYLKQVEGGKCIHKCVGEKCA